MEQLRHTMFWLMKGQIFCGMVDSFNITNDRNPKQWIRTLHLHKNMTDNLKTFSVDLIHCISVDRTKIPDCATGYGICHPGTMWISNLIMITSEMMIHHLNQERIMWLIRTYVMKIQKMCIIIWLSKELEKSYKLNKMMRLGYFQSFQYPELTKNRPCQSGRKHPVCILLLAK